METTPVGDVVEVGQADYLSTMAELADFSSVKVSGILPGERGEGWRWHGLQGKDSLLGAGRVII